MGWISPRISGIMWNAWSLEVSSLNVKKALSCHMRWKATKKRMNAGELKPERVDLFEKLLALADENKHVNQYV